MHLAEAPVTLIGLSRRRVLIFAVEHEEQQSCGLSDFGGISRVSVVKTSGSFPFTSLFHQPFLTTRRKKSRLLLHESLHECVDSFLKRIMAPAACNETVCCHSSSRFYELLEGANCTVLQDTGCKSKI